MRHLPARYEPRGGAPDDRGSAGESVLICVQKLFAIGRKNFMFLGTDEGGAVNATFTSLLASCEMHKVPPLAYLRDVFCLMSAWQASGADLLELAPANWAVTSQRPDVIALLEANHFRRAGLG